MTDRDKLYWQKGYRAGKKDKPKLTPNEETTLLLRQIAEKGTITIRQLHNLNVEIQSLRAEQAKLRSVVLTLLADPQAQHDAEAVLKDFYNTQKK